MVKIVQIISCQISCADCAGGGNSSDWNKKENTPWIPLLRLSGRLHFENSFCACLYTTTSGLASLEPQNFVLIAYNGNCKTVVELCVFLKKHMQESQMESWFALTTWTACLSMLHSFLFQVCRRLGIIEVDYFGLQFTGSKGESLWLNLRNRISQQMDGLAPYRLKLRVKFFVEPHLILQEQTR